MRLQRVHRSAGRSHLLKMRMCSHPRRLQWIVIDWTKPATRQRILYKQYCRCTSFKFSRTLNSCVHKFASLEKTTCHHCSIVRSYLVEVGILRTWTPPIIFDCPSSVLGNCHQFGWDHVLRVELYVVEFWCVHHVQLLKVCDQKNSFPTFSHRVPDVFEECFGVILCSELVEFQ